METTINGFEGKVPTDSHLKPVGLNLNTCEPGHCRLDDLRRMQSAETEIREARPILQVILIALGVLALFLMGAGIAALATGSEDGSPMTFHFLGFKWVTGHVGLVLVGFAAIAVIVLTGKVLKATEVLATLTSRRVENINN